MELLIFPGIMIGAVLVLIGLTVWVMNAIIRRLDPPMSRSEALRFKHKVTMVFSGLSMAVLVTAFIFSFIFSQDENISHALARPLGVSMFLGMVGLAAGYILMEHYDTALMTYRGE